MISVTTPILLFAFRHVLYNDDVRHRMDDARRRQLDTRVSELLAEFDDDDNVDVVGNVD